MASNLKTRAKLTGNLRTAILKLRQGGSFSELVETAGRDVHVLAQSFLRGSYHNSMEVDDMEQIILLSLWKNTMLWSGKYELCGFVLWMLKKDMYNELMMARGLKRTEDDRWLGCEQILVDDSMPEPEPDYQTTPEVLVQQKERAERFVDRTCYTERETVLVMSALKQGSVLNGAKYLVTQPEIKELGLVRDVNWISKAILRALNRARKELDGNQKKDQAEDSQARGGRQDRPGEGGHSTQGIRLSGEVCEQDVRSTNEATIGGRLRSRRLSSKPRPVVQSVYAC